ncbi:MAG: hypothetical protein WC875_05980 [Candidatus Absconditabacterales bacterium]
MEKITNASIDRKSLTLKIVCTHTVRQIADTFANLLNNPADGGHIFPKYMVNGEDDMAEITFRNETQLFLMRDADSIHISNDSKSMPYDEDISFEYERLCKRLGIKLED